MTVKKGRNRVRNTAVKKARNKGVSFEEEIIAFEKRRSSNKTNNCWGRKRGVE